MEILTRNFYVGVLAIAVSFLAILVTFFKRRFLFWRRRGVYTLPFSVPFGNAANLILQKKHVGAEFKNVYDAFKQKGVKYGGYYIFGKPIFIPVDLDLVKHMMVKHFDHFTDHLMHVDVENQPLTGHLFSLKGVAWRKLRNKLNPAFTSGKTRMMFETVVECTKWLPSEVDRMMKEDKSIDTKELLSRFTIDVIGSCAFGTECNSLRNPNAEFAVYCRRFFCDSLWDSIVRFLSFFSPEMFKYIKIYIIQKDVHNFFMKIVKENVNYREKHNIARKDFMHLLIQLKNKVDIEENKLGELTNTAVAESTKDDSETSLTLEEIAAQCFIFFLASYETSSATLTYCLYELVRSPELQEKVRDEIKTVLSRHGGEITYDAITEMSFMEMCIYETLRKYPPVSVLTRACTKRYHVPNSDLVLEKGAFVFIPVLGIHMDTEFYPDPERFDPERFSAGNKVPKHSSAWIPFGDGPRICIGFKFGMAQTKAGLTVLLKNYRFTLNPKTKTPLVMDPSNSLTSTVIGGVWLNAEKIVL